MSKIKEIHELFNIIHKLKRKYPNRQFTLDGRLVGDIGEIIAQNEYKINLYKKQTEIYDGVSSNGKKVQIKTTFKEKITFPCESSKVPDYLIGIKLFENGEHEIIYNGPGVLIYNLLKDRKKTKNGYHLISVKKLKEINLMIPKNNKIIKNKNKSNFA